MGLYAQQCKVITMYGIVCSTRGDNNNVWGCCSTRGDNSNVWDCILNKGDNSNVWDCMVENHLIGLSESHQYFKKEVTIIFNFFIDTTHIVFAEPLIEIRKETLTEVIATKDQREMRCAKSFIFL